VNELVVERLGRAARGFEPGFALGQHRVHARLDVQRLDERVRVEEQLENRVQQAADEAQPAAVRIEERVVLERVVRQLGRLIRRLRFAELFEQVRADAARIEELLQLDGGKLANLFLGVVHTALVADAGADLLHDLLDVDRVRAHGEVGHSQFGR
jgi:hypothetical protein